MLHFIARLVLCCALVLVETPAWAETPKPPEIKALRLGKHNSNTRIVFEFSGQHSLTPQKIFTLSNPDRVVLDFPLTRFAAKAGEITIPPHLTVSGLRQGQFDADTLRVVLDMTGPVKTNTFSLKPTKTQGARLVVDLIPTKARVKVSSSVKKKPAPPAASVKKEVSEDKTAVNITQKGGVIIIDQPRATPSLVATGKKRRDKIVVIIDPGHGGVDPGAIGRHKSYEKDVVLAIGREVRDIINDTPGYVAHMTRDKDIFIPLAQRVKTAQRRKGDLFVSIHADSHANRDVRGGSVYVLSETASDKEAERLARQANEGDMVAGIDLSEEEDQVRNILIDLVQRETMNKSAVFAREMIRELDSVVKMKSTEPRFAGFRVLKAPEVPSILVEASYLSNADDESMLNNPKAQKRLAASIARGIFNYSRQHLNAE